MKCKKNRSLDVSHFCQYIHQLMYIIVTNWLNHINTYCLNNHFDFIQIIMEILISRRMYQYATALSVFVNKVSREKISSLEVNNRRIYTLKWAVQLKVSSTSWKGNLYSTICEMPFQRGLTSRSYCLFGIYVLGRGVTSSMLMSVMKLAIFE